MKYLVLMILHFWHILINALEHPPFRCLQQLLPDLQLKHRLFMVRFSFYSCIQLYNSLIFFLWIRWLCLRFWSWFLWMESRCSWCDYELVKKDWFEETRSKIWPVWIFSYCSMFCCLYDYNLFSTYKTNTSYYIFFDSDDYDYWWGGSTDRAKLKSPKINGDVAQCLEFWYHINGINYNLIII